MKLSIGLVAVVTAVPDDFEQPEACLDLGEDFVNCWQPHSDLGWCSQNRTDYTQTGECGFQYKDGQSMTNATCKGFDHNINGFTFDWGNAAFVAKVDTDEVSSGDVVGLDFSGDVNIVGKWNVQFNECPQYEDELANYVAALNDANENNTTKPAPFTWEEPANYCYFDEEKGDLLVDNGYFTPPTCTYNADGYYSEYAIMITNQHAGDANNNYAIANYGGKDNVFTVSLGGSCHEHPPTPHDANQAEITFLSEADKDSCTFVVTVLKGQAQLFYFQGTLDNNAVVNFWDVTIA